MNTTHSSTPEDEVSGYAELQREMHDALRAQHPEWVQPNGDSPICDAYESRFEELLSLSLQFERAHAHYARQAYQTKKDSLSQAATAVRILRHEPAARIDRRFANFAAKATCGFGKFKNAISNLINGINDLCHSINL